MALVGEICGAAPSRRADTQSAREQFSLLPYKEVLPLEAGSVVTYLL